MKRTLVTLILASLVMSSLPLNVSAGSDDDIPTNAQNTGDHASLVAALAHAGLVETLQGDGPFTVFAPTDAAFAAAGIDLADFDTPEENATLADILTYHVYDGAVASADVADGMVVTMFNGAEAVFAVGSDGAVSIEGANVTTADVQSSNGVIHVIDAVLMPPVAMQTIDVFVDGGSMSAPYFNFYTDIAGTTLLADNTLDITQTYIFHRLNSATTHPFYISDAGNGQASTAALMLSGDGSETSGITGDESFTLSFDSSITPDATVNFFCTVHTSMVSVFDLTGFPVTVTDIPAVAQSTGIHTALVAALAKADLVTALQADGPFTVFAPTDAAFTAAGIDLDTFVTEAEIATLADILTYHVYVGAVASTSVTDGMTVTMLNGDDASFTVSEAGVMIEGATVTTADVEASNGVIHVIDAVLMPPVDSVDEPAPTPCDVTVRIAPSGLKYSPAEVSITVGQTVCWQWTNESMAHNVREVDGDMSTTFKANGITSGESMTTVDFRHTFDTDSTTFYYACEPHLAAGMYGKVIVGDGGAVVMPPADVPDTDDDSSESVPGFLTLMTTVALAGAAIVASRRNE